METISFIYLFIFRERGREGEREGEKPQGAVASHAPLLGTWPATQACALTGNQSSDPLVCRPKINPLRYTSQCWKPFLNAQIYVTVPQF